MSISAATLAILVSSPTAHATAAAPACTEQRFPVTIAGLEQTMAATLCVPPGGTPAVQVLVPGGFYNRGYWDIPVAPEKHSFRRAMNHAGYATLAVDRLGTGASSVPPSGVLTALTQADAVHQVVGALRKRFETVILGGHSLGSAIAIIEAATYHDVDGVLVTAMGHNPDPLGLAPIATTFVPAALDPAFAARPLDPGYLTTRPGTRWESLHAPGPYDPAIDALDEKTKDVVAPTELADGALLGTVTPYSALVDVPVLTVMAEGDPTFRAPERDGSSASAALLAAEDPFYGPAARLRAYVLPGYGHSLNYAPNAPALHGVVVRWADGMVRE